MKKYLEYATARDEIIDLYAKENNIDLYCSSVIDFNNRKLFLLFAIRMEKMYNAKSR